MTFIRVTTLFRLSLIGIVCAEPLLAQQADAIVLSAERVAVRAALERSSAARTAALVVAINPMVVREGAAPGGDGVRLRDAARNVELTREIGASARRRSDVVSCQESAHRPLCSLRNADLYISLSEPRLEETKAIVTVTLESSGGRGTIHYETLSVTLVRDGSTWKVETIEQLGIS